MRLSLAWDGIDPDRLDTAVVVAEHDGLTARGASVGDDQTVTYVVTTGAQWVSQQLDVDVASSVAGRRRLRLGRRDDGTWWARYDDGPVEPLDLDGVLDCDLGECLLTNTMPILRHDMVGAARRDRGEPVELRMALVSVPDLGVALSEQRYTPLGATEDGGARILFESDDFSAELLVDAHGLLLDYPGLGRRR